MNWVSIDLDRCKDCGLCVPICMRCFSRKEGKIEAFANEENCNLCGHCVAVCPERAIIHQQLNMGAFVELGERGKIDEETFVSFLKRRRSHRNFMSKEIPREVLERLIDICRLAPTGSNLQNVELFILQDREKMEKLVDLTVDYFRKNIPRLEKRVEKLKAAGKPIPYDLQWAHARSKRYEVQITARKAGGDPIFHRAPAVFIFHSMPYTSTAKDNCVIAAHTVALAAMTMGLETCYIGLFASAFQNYPPVAREVGIPSEHEMVVLVLAYPKTKFLRTVDRKPLKVKWE